MKRIDPRDFAEEPGVEPGTLKQLIERMARRQRNLRNPDYGHVRHYPSFSQGRTTTAGYIAEYEADNARRIMKGPGFTHGWGPAPWNMEVSE